MSCLTLDMQSLPGTTIEYLKNLRVLRPRPYLHYVDDRLFPALFWRRKPLCLSSASTQRRCCLLSALGRLTQDLPQSKLANFSLRCKCEPTLLRIDLANISRFELFLCQLRLFLDPLLVALR